MAHCSMCHNLNLEDLWEEEDEDQPDMLFHSTPEMQKCAVQGCTLCVFFLHDLHKHFNLDSEYFLEQPHLAAYKDNLFLTWPETDVRYWILDLPADLDVSFEFTPRHRLDSPNSSQAFDLVAAWMADCGTNHTACKQQHDFIPKRLLDLGDSSEAEAEIIHLHATSFEEKPKYAALSYCWGQSPNLITTLSTLKNRMDGVTLSSLPRVVREAVHVTRKLGMRFLWVDALCILQGREPEARQDWEIQSAKMAQIYGNAHVTICALGATNCQENLLMARKSRSTYAIPISKDTSKGKARLELEIQDSMKSQPLNFRGWTLQESVLSSRTVLFGPNMIYWACRTQTDSEAGSDVSNLSSNISRSLKSGLFTNSDPAGSFWDDLVSEYTQRSITVASDKLPALSGIASIVYLRSNSTDHYHAGLWESRFPQQLLWRHAPKSQSCPHPLTSYRAPSWSWASTDCAVIFPSFKSDYNITWASETSVLGCFTEVKGLDPFGAVEKGEIVLEGPIKRVYLGFGRKDNRARGDSTYKFGLVDPEDGDLLSADGLYLDCRSTGNTDRVNFTSPERCCLLIYAEKRRRHVNKWMVQHAGLVLEQWSCKAESWKRIGMFYFWEPSKRDWFYDSPFKSVIIL